MISLEKVRKGIAFYGLENLSERILSGAGALNRSEALPSFEKRVNDLYTGDPGILEELYGYHTPDALFAPGISPDAPLVAAALGAGFHRDNMDKFGFDADQREKQISRMRDYIGFLSREGNTTALAWSANLARGVLLEVGILQFQLVRHKDGKSVIYMHIPGGQFTEENVRTSVEESRRLVRRYYGLENPDYLCESWLLSPEVHNLLGENSNIYRFYNLFDVIPGEDCKADILWNVFGITDPRGDLKEKTSLQRSIKKAFTVGKNFRIGIGRWKEREKS